MKSVCIVLFQNVGLHTVACQHTLPYAHNRCKGFTHACVTVPLIALPLLCLSLRFRLPFFSLVSPLCCTCRSPLHPLCAFMLPHSVLYLYMLISISLGFHCTLYWLNIINRQRCTEASIRGSNESVVFTESEGLHIEGESVCFTSSTGTRC